MIAIILTAFGVQGSAYSQRHVGGNQDVRQNEDAKGQSAIGRLRMQWINLPRVQMATVPPGFTNFAASAQTLFISNQWACSIQLLPVNEILRELTAMATVKRSSGPGCNPSACEISSARETSYLMSEPDLVLPPNSLVAAIMAGPASRPTAWSNERATSRVAFPGRHLQLRRTPNWPPVAA
jgi:hypothetical protein